MKKFLSFSYLLPLFLIIARGGEHKQEKCGCWLNGFTPKWFGGVCACFVGWVGCIGLMVGLLPQHWWLGQRIFLTITAIPSLSFIIHLSIHSASQAKKGRPLTIRVFSQQIPTPLLWPLPYTHILGWRLWRTQHRASWIKQIRHPPESNSM